ncbi:MAG: IS3 family transposase [bacterium]|nr:IS3 family transposase [bacterium]
MSSTGNCYDNAAMEIFFSSLKIECIQGLTYQSREQAKINLFDWIERWYNKRRQHSFLGYVSPEEFERKATMS